MNTLDSSGNLEYRLKNVACSDELKIEILKLIENEHDGCTGKPMSFSNIIYRGNLQYIEENIDNINLINELRNFNNKFQS